MKLKRINRGQSAIEYLMTYGWMLLVVAVVGGAVFSVVGEQSIESVSGFDSSHVSVQDFGVSSESGLMFSLSDPVSRTEIREIRLSNPGSANVSYVLNQRASDVDVVNLPGINPSDSSNELKVEIFYDVGGLENMSTIGTVNGDLAVDEAFHDRTLIMNGLVGYWPLDEKYASEDIVYDLTLNNNYAEITEGTTFETDTTKGEVVDLDGESGELIVSSTESLDIQDEITVVSWFRANEDIIERDTGWYGGIQKGSSWLFGWNGWADGWAYGIYNEDGDWQSSASHTHPMEEGDWHHFAGTFNVNTGLSKIYINGSLMNERQNDGNMQSNNNNIRIGYRGEYWYGRGTEVMIYDRELEASEIETIYYQ